MLRRYGGGYEPERRGTLNGRLKLILAIWAVAYPVIACGPALITEGGVSGFVGNFISLTLGGLLFVPWILGLLVLGALVWATTPRRYRP